jgi:hypothetical protein
MRDLVWQIFGIALSVALTALALLYPNALGAWRAVFFIAAAVFVLTAIGLLTLRGKDRARLHIIGPNLLRDPRFKNSNRWSMRVGNRGPAAARHVLVRMQSASTRPRSDR